MPPALWRWKLGAAACGDRAEGDFLDACFCARRGVSALYRRRPGVRCIRSKPASLLHGPSLSYLRGMLVRRETEIGVIGAVFLACLTLGVGL